MDYLSNENKSIIMKKYIAPMVEIQNTEAYSMIALSLQNGKADSGSEVLSRDDDWNLWDDDQDI